MNTMINKWISGLIAIILIAGILWIPTAAEPAGNTVTQSDSTSFQSVLSYHEYLTQHANAAVGKENISLTAADVVKHSGDVSVAENWNGNKNASVLTGEESSVTYRFSVSAEGLYALSIAYYPTKGKGSSIVRSFALDGKLPYEEVREIDFPRRWKDAGKITQDANGNDIRPTQQEAPCWMKKSLVDSMGYYTQPLQFYLSPGEHTLSVVSVKEPMAISEIVFSPATQTVSYQTRQKEYQAQGLTDTSGFYQQIQGEDAAYKSDASIYAIYDRSSPDTEPTSAAQIKLNTIGGSKWSVSGQWLEWSVTVPETGLYTLGIKGRQNLLNGAYSCRELSVNGEVPFTEAEEIRFNYDTGWNMTVLADKNGTAYRIPLVKGTNTIRMEVTLGILSDLLMETSECISNLNDVYMKILMITGPSPDTMRDYQFRKQIPETLTLLQQQGEKLEKLYYRYIKLTGQNGQQAQTLKKMYVQAKELVSKPDTIASRFSSFSTNITDMGTWLTTVSEQPLEIDYLVIASPDKKIEAVKNSMLRNIWFSVRQLIASFVQDYDVMSADDGNSKDSITVWVGNGATGGRDQAQVLQRMVTNEFTVQTGIQANIQLVSMGALLPATMSKRGPDVALTLNASDPINYAIRHGVVDLSKMQDFDTVKSRFMSSAMEPFSFDGGVYALPETQTFYMMFYRKDILEQLKISVPDTWQDVVNILPVLQKKNLNFGLPTVISDAAVGIGFPAYAMFLFQSGGTLYNQNGSKSMLSSKAGVDAFFKWTKFYTDYSVPTQYDFMNRFRSGAIPIGIADYSMYNTLQVFAPEIKGRWDFCAVPGTVQKDGTVDRSACGSTTGCVILSTSEKVKQSWEFLKWWTSGNVQGNFGVELESVLGAAGRYSPANIEALYQIPWSKSQFDKITTQWKHVKGLREVPGSYMTSRFVDFAFRNAVNNSDDPDESLRDAVKQINAEIKLRRQEFGLSED